MAGPVQSVSFTGTSSPISVTLSATGTGNCLVVFFGATGISVPTITGITLGGAAGNFAQAAGVTTAILDTEIWTDFNATPGQTAVSISFGGSSPHVAGRVEEWAGIITSGNPVDKTSTGNDGGSAGTSWSSGATATLTQANETVVGMSANTSGTNNTITGPSSPWTNQAEVDQTVNLGELNGWQLVSATTAQTYSGTFNSLGRWAAVVVTLLEPAVPFTQFRSGSLIARTRHSDGVWGGVASSLIPPPPGGTAVRGALIARTRHSDAVWGGIASSLTAAPPPTPPPGPATNPPVSGGDRTAGLWEQLHTDCWKPVYGFGTIDPGSVPTAGYAPARLTGRALEPPPPVGYQAAGPPPKLDPPGPTLGERIADTMGEAGAGLYELGRALSQPPPPAKTKTCRCPKTVGMTLLTCQQKAGHKGMHTDGRVWWR